jgi:hypothetical protein
MSLAQLLSTLAQGSRRHVRTLAAQAVLGLAAVAFASVGIAFATYALFEALRELYGAVHASLVVSAVYFIVAAIVSAISRRVGHDRRPPKSAASESAPSPTRAAPSADAPQIAAIAMGLDLAKQMSPLQLTLLAALSGFIAGRRV